MRIAPDSTNQSIYVHLASSADGTDATGLEAADLTVSYQRGNGALVGVSLSDLSAITDAHSDGGVIHAGGGVYRIDAPDAAWAAGVDRVRVYVSADDVVQTAGVTEITLDAPVSSRLPASVQPVIEAGANAAAAAADNTASLPEMIDNNQFTAEALANAPSGGGGSVVVTPITSTVSTGEVVSDDIVAYQGEARAFLFVIADADKQPVDLSGKTLRFVAHDRRDPPLPKFAVEHAAITISGDNHNQVRVPFDADQTADLYDGFYSLWSLSDNLVLARGALKIEPARKEAP